MYCSEILYWDIWKHLTLTGVFPLENKGRKGVLNNAVYKIMSGVLSWLLSLLNNRTIKCKFVSLPYQIYIIFVERFIGYMEKCIYGFINIRFYYESNG